MTTNLYIAGSSCIASSPSIDSGIQTLVLGCRDRSLVYLKFTKFV